MPNPTDSSPPPTPPQDAATLLVVPEGTPAWITPQLIRRTLEVWQPSYLTTLSVQDAVAILVNVGRLAEILAHPVDASA